jgi:NADH:ubiquinone oxidoreductase subunit 5 (subunit L)/multisubunit Na+/H+ antiporter MnhA subunit
LAAFLAVVQGQASWGAVVIAALSLIGGLALVCFTKVFGVVFLGEPRGEKAAQAHECGWPMRMSMIILAAGCLAVGLYAPEVFSWSAEAVRQLSGLSAPAFMTHWEAALQPLQALSGAATVLWCLIAAAALLRLRLMRGRQPSRGLTWDCGYASPSARIQYTGSSFAQPITQLFSFFLRTRRRSVAPEGFFPAAASFSTETPDVFREGLYRPAFDGVLKGVLRLRWLQHGRIQLYVLYIALTLLLLLAWRLGCS